MKIIQKFDGLITNNEVLEVIKENRKQRSSKTTHSSLQNREFIETQTLQYLKSQKTINFESFKKVMKDIQDLNFNLIEAEILQLLNHTPQLPVEVHLVINLIRILI